MTWDRLISIFNSCLDEVLGEAPFAHKWISFCPHPAFAGIVRQHPSPDHSGIVDSHRERPGCDELWRLVIVSVTATLEPSRARRPKLSVIHMTSEKRSVVMEAEFFFGVCIGMILMWQLVQSE